MEWLKNAHPGHLIAAFLGVMIVAVIVGFIIDEAVTFRKNSKNRKKKSR